MDAVLKKKAEQIRLAVFDIDGVMTNGALIFSDDGKEIKIFDVQDGLGLVLLKQANIEPAIISSRSSKIVTRRITELGIEHIYQGQKDKRQTLLKLMDKLNLDSASVAYTGDDWVDLPAMTAAGLSIAVANARPQVKDRADWVTSKEGGRGAVREICEMLLQAQSRLDMVLKNYSA